MGMAEVLLRPRRCNAWEAMFCVCAHCDRADSATAAMLAGNRHESDSDVRPTATTSKPSGVEKRTGYDSLPIDGAAVDPA